MNRHIYICIPTWTGHRAREGQVEYVAYEPAVGGAGQQGGHEETGLYIHMHIRTIMNTMQTCILQRQCTYAIVTMHIYMLLVHTVL